MDEENMVVGHFGCAIWVRKRAGHQVRRLRQQDTMGVAPDMGTDPVSEAVEQEES